MRVLRTIYHLVRWTFYTPLLLVMAGYTGFRQGRLDTLDVQDDYDSAVKMVRRYNSAREVFRACVQRACRCSPEAAEDMALMSGFVPARRSLNAVARLTAITAEVGSDH